MLAATYPWFLLGLSGIALPIAAHLIYSQQSQLIRFSSIRLITPTRTPQRRRKGITDALLLLLRILIIICVVLAIAGIEWIPPGSTYFQRETVILLDMSASMNTTSKQARAKALVEELIADEDGLAGLIIYGREPTTLSAPVSDKPSLLQALQDAVPTLEEGDPQKAIQATVQLFSAETSTKHLAIVSDFQSSDWQQVNYDLRNRSVSFSLHRITGDPVRDPIDDLVDNQAILSVDTSELSSQSLRVSVSLINYNPEDQQRTIRLSIAGEQFEKTVALPSGQIKQIFFKVPKVHSGKSIVRMTEDDSYPQDNELFFWLTRPLPSRVAIVTPASAPQRSLDEAKFLGAALLSRSDYEWQRFAVVDFLNLQSGMQDTDHTDILMIAGLPKDISPALGAQLRLYLQSGGIVLATTGNGMAETLSQLNRFQILSTQFVGTGSKTRLDMTPFRISALEPDSHLQSVFSGSAANDLMLTRIYRFSKIKLLEPATVIARVDGDYPLIIDKLIGKGHLIFFTLRMDLKWSDLPLRPSFVPLLKELVLPYIEIPEHPSLMINEPLISDRQSFSSAQPGLFIEKAGLVAVNVSRRESLPETLAASTITEILGGSSLSKPAGQAAIANNAEARLVENSQLREPLWQWLILAALFFLILESVLAWHGASPKGSNANETSNLSRSANSANNMRTAL